MKLLICQNQSFFIILYQTLFRREYYTYSDEDFCYFKDFPHTRNVMPILKPNMNLSCTCTHLFLIKYSYLLRNELNDFISNSGFQWTYQNFEYYENLEPKSYLNDCSAENIAERIQKCYFKKRLNLCKIEPFKQDDNSNDFKTKCLKIQTNFKTLVLKFKQKIRPPSFF